MKIGDKVRLLRGTEEGRIVNIKGNKIVEIEIEEGFIIPALRSEVVVVDRSEAESFQEENDNSEPNRKEIDPGIDEGIYLGFDIIGHDKFQAYLINQTQDPILFTICQYDKKSINGKSFGICKSFNFVEIGSFTSSIFNESKRIYIQLIIHEKDTKHKKSPIVKAVAIDKKMLEEKVYVRAVAKQISLINLERENPIKIDATELRDRMMSGSKDMPIESQHQISQVEEEIDLHIYSESASLNPNEILEIQLNEFEKAYDNALVMNLQKLKVIHGVGVGILRNEIHKRLSKKTEVKFFEDADKERFGFGSTIIYF